MSSDDPAGVLAPPPMLLPDNPTSPGNATAAPPLTDSPPAPGTLLSPPPGANGSFKAVPPPSISSNNQVRVALLIGIGIGGLIMLVCVGIFVFWYKRRKRAHGLYGFANASEQGPKDYPFGSQSHNWPSNVPPSSNNTVGMPQKLSTEPGIVSTFQSQFSPIDLPSSKQTPNVGASCSKSTFTYEELAIATDNFSNTNLLGQGGFGYVHKGVLGDGREVAIKKLKVGSGQGEREFQAEVEIISNVHHFHLVSLVGHCISGAQRLLVYEFVPNNTLEFHLHGKGLPPMSWEIRMRIALGSAKGLAYLHEDCRPKIIHRDIKAANILLDNNFEPKVADFGLARLNPDADTHVSTRVMGTFGYLAPEYALTGKLTEKSDVFSFGVMLLELITGRRPIDKAQYYLDDNIVDWARPLLSQAMDDGNFEALADPKLMKNYDSTEMTRMVTCAAVCVRHLSRRRPRMSQIVRALEGNLPVGDLIGGVRPGHSGIQEPFGSSDYDSAQYKEDLLKFRKMALETQTQNSSECSGPTSEFGPHPSGSSSEGLRTTQDTQSGTEIQRGTTPEVREIEIQGS
ncbi:PREDICTED: proline-rich receptor-like protein kinase PERK15 [Ipomoea nil]|uniref:proline-rich receptor-like protein kinase PERK15 n=1 Tax=Ipomoea nil TaxID=35883 RepID=UPI0009016160|nr:PREDICTED: proline-rich receptor-like protein kinase PERK15 [Ipomoea nil]